ncbi:uncharacterized protein LOC26515192 [Drosophila ananassae]|uniref:uncharacterized protein LOC26515192 n=1 Tax=Drosophila ananassae TaxID=7217 RepID=UPI001CFF7C4D|nr:uncharacterized protein LOC26515192 [Drosophila ananassae]
MSDTTASSFNISIKDSGNSLGGESAVVSYKKSMNAKRPQSPNAAVDFEHEPPEVSIIDDDIEDEDEVDVEDEVPEVEAIQPNQVIKPPKGAKRGKGAKGSRGAKASKLDEDERMYLKVVADKETVHRFQIKSSTKMARLMGAYSIHTGLPIENFRFYYRGKVVDKNDTVQTLSMRWGAVIDAFTDPSGWDDTFKELLNSM